MCLTSILIWWITVFLTISLRTECYPRMYPRTFQERGWSSANQQLLDSQIQATIPQSQPKINDPVPQQREKKVSVLCHDATIEVVINADLFASGFPVFPGELWLGPGMSSSCGAVQTGELVFTIIAYFKDCGTKLSVSLKNFWLSALSLLKTQVLFQDEMYQAQCSLPFPDFNWHSVFGEILWVSEQK